MTAVARTNGRSRVPIDVAPPPAQQQLLPSPGANVELMAAILRVQAALPKLATTADGQIGGRTYRYTDLGAVVDAVLPLLVIEQLAWVTFPTSDEHGAPALRYRITHLPSHEFEQDVMPLMCAKPDPQGQGSALTYAARYALRAVFNITIGDDDGAAASAPASLEAFHNHSSTVQPAQPTTPQPTARPATGGDRPASAAQRRKIEAKVSEADLTPEEFANILKVAGGADKEQWSDGAAERWVKRAMDRLPARLVTPVLAAIAEAGS